MDDVKSTPCKRDALVRSDLRSWSGGQSAGCVGMLSCCSCFLRPQWCVEQLLEVGPRTSGSARRDLGIFCDSIVYLHSIRGVEKETGYSLLRHYVILLREAPSESRAVMGHVRLAASCLRCFFALSFLLFSWLSQLYLSAKSESKRKSAHPSTCLATGVTGHVSRRG